MNTFTKDFLKKLNDTDYKFYYHYSRLDECIEIIRKHYLVPNPNQITPIKLHGIEDIFFLLNDNIIVDYKVKVIGERYELFEMELSIFNRYENQFSAKLRSED